MFAHKVFCAWDFSTATSEGAALKSKSIYNELKVRTRPVLLPLRHLHLLFFYFHIFPAFSYTSSSASAFFKTDQVA
jgi:hypothetical protein